MKIIIIAAMARNRVIGRGNAIPWRVAGEQARFKQVTMGHPLVMGRKTFESIGRPLPGRKNIVVSRRQDYRPSGCLVAGSLEAALALCREEDTVFVAGGGQVYRQALPWAEEIRLTVIERVIAGDVYFPEFYPLDFQEISAERITEPEPYTIRVYRRGRGV